MAKTLPFSVLLTLLVFHSAADAGVGPENVIVVVNARSPVSRTLANHYVELREIPSSNVIFLDDVPTDQLKISLDSFKDHILSPVLAQINQRRLAAQARVIAYSADFPTSVDISPHTEKLTDDQLTKLQKPTASINSLTYFYRFVLSDNPLYLGWHSNLYARGPFERHFANPFGGPAGVRFAAAQQAVNEQRHAEAAAEFAALFEQHATFSPLAILAAESYARAEDLDAAARMLRRGILAGWVWRQYLTDSETLGPLMSKPEIISLSGRLNDWPVFVQGPVGFASTRGWTVNGHWIDQADRAPAYLMSCLLAVVHPRGSTLPQAVDVLERSANADHSFPPGGFWFTRTNDVRTTTRLPHVGDALLWLKHFNRDAQLLRSTMPNQGGPCVGLMLGTAKMSLSDADWEFVPGAIADNLTSFNGRFDTASQTKLTALLHAGAAMSSGAVQEPYAIAAKFPLPMMYGYYATGTTSIEAFYLSVSSPYQLLIVGDPLCQPFARPPSDWLTIEAADAENKQIRVRRFAAQADGPTTVTRHMELFIEGQLVRELPAVANVNIRLPPETAGSTEVRVALVGSDPTEPRSWFSQWLQWDDDSSSPTAELKSREVQPQRPPSDDSPSAATIQLHAEGAKSIELMHHSVKLAEVAGPAGEVTVGVEQVGAGPVRLRPYAVLDDDRRIAGKPIVLKLSSPTN